METIIGLLTLLSALIPATAEDVTLVRHSGDYTSLTAAWQAESGRGGDAGGYTWCASYASDHCRVVLLDDDLDAARDAIDFFEENRALVCAPNPSDIAEWREWRDARRELRGSEGALYRYAHELLHAYEWSQYHRGDGGHSYVNRVINHWLDGDYEDTGLDAPEACGEA